MGKTPQDSPDSLEAMRHSLAHIMASAVVTIWPEAKLGVGPVIENGFYYDIDLGKAKISEEDFPKIEAEMNKIIKDDQSFERSEQPIDAGIAWAKKAKQPYKEELLNDLKREGTTLARELDASLMGLPAGIAGVTPAEAEIGKVSFYKNGSFIDLCRGPHLSSTGKAGAFKLMRVAGAYWRGNEKNPQMQRLYGVAFATQKELDKHLALLEEAKKRDHRKLGKELDLFVNSPLVGSGLPLFTPRGTILREELNRYSQELRANHGYQKVWTPHIAKQELYEVSGHWGKFGDEWLKVESQETSDKLVMKPMNCPHHQQIYASRQRSYRDLPLKYMETTTDYRDEKAGELLGLARVRAISQDDSHTFCTPDQIYDVMKTLVGIVSDFYAVLGLPLKIRLSFRDESDAYLGDKKLWDKAQTIIREVAESSGLEYYEGPGEAAFYGPKIDFMAEDALGRELQVATPQLDFVQPQRFDLKYVDKDGQEKTPVMIHFALLGSIERFLSVYIEHTGGRFPVWLAPEQIRIITVSQDENILGFARDMLDKAQSMGLRTGLDEDSGSVGKKIRTAELLKIPYIVVIGEKEVKSKELVPRIRNDIQVQETQRAHKLDDFLKTVSNEAVSRVTKTSL